MTHYGTIKSYDSAKGSGMIAAEKGGNELPFGKADLQQQAQEPQVDQRYGYETSEVNGANKRAINLRQQGENPGQMEQAQQQQG